MKFGGTSVATAEAISRAIFIIGNKLNKKPIVVVSALSKVTDLLYNISDQAERQNIKETEELLNQLRTRHVSLATELLSGSPMLLEDALDRVNSICDSLSELTKAVCAVGELSPRNKAIIISNGELLSSSIICFAMNSRGIKTNWLDARKMMVTTKDYLKGEPIVDEINSRVPLAIEEAYNGMDAVITQGFIATTAEGVPTVLGRGGSDYSASLIGLAVDAEAIEIWTDVDGVKTADPRVVENTKSLDKISFEEAAEMAHFGAKVLHPLTIEPAIKKNIPIFVLNSMNPTGPGTAILRNEFIEDGVKSVSFKENIRVINIFSTRMINTSGFLTSVFRCFSENRVSVDLISTSEANISVTIDASENIDKVVEELSGFAEVIVDSDKSQVSVIGKNIVKLNGMLKKTFAPLKNCNVYMISQGASFVNISFVVDREDVKQVVCDLHKYLFETEEEFV